MLKISIRGLDEVRRYLAEMTRDLKRVAEYAVIEYLVGDERHGLAHYPPYKHVSFQEAYGGFLSDKQRRYVMGAISRGEIDPGVSSSNRYFGDAWQIRDKGKFYQAVNDTAHGGYLVGDQTQPVQQSLVMQKKGWRTVTQNISDNIVGALRHARAKVGEYLRSKK